MRRISTFVTMLLAAGAASACKPDEVVKTEDIPTAGVRFINALPDSAGAFGLDMRFVDIVESNVQFRITFRNGPSTTGTGGVMASGQTQFRAARAGQRRFRIFLDDTLQVVASTVLKDTTVTLEAGKTYTAILMGQARLGTMQLRFFEDVAPDPGAQIGLRVMNATESAIDVRHYALAGTAPATATWAGVAAYGTSSFVTAAVGDYMYNVRAAGSATNMFADMRALIGAPKDLVVGIDALPGTTQAGSAVTLVVYPRSTAGARTPQTAAFLVPAGSFMWDRRPPR